MSIRIIIEEDLKFAGDYDKPGMIQGGLISLLLHGTMIFLAAFFSHQQTKSELLLTEITMVEQIIPIPEEAAPPPPPPMPKEKTNVWDFLKQAVPLKKAPELASQLPMELPKKAESKLSAMPEALKLGDKKSMDKPALANKALDLVGRKAVRAPAGMNINPLQMNKKKTSLASTSKLPSGIKLGKKSTFSGARQAPVLNTQRFAKRANLQARGGSLSDMPTIKKKIIKKKKVDLSGAGLNLKREQNTFQVFGEIANRQRIKMFMPRYPRWAEEQGIECTVSVHLFVLPSGSVKNNLYVEQGSGYGEIDRLAMTALKKFKFAPLLPSERQVEQEGVIVFYFRLSR